MKKDHLQDEKVSDFITVWVINETIARKKNTGGEPNSTYPHMYFSYIALTYLLCLIVIYMHYGFENKVWGSKYEYCSSHIQCSSDWAN